MAGTCQPPRASSPRERRTRRGRRSREVARVGRARGRECNCCRGGSKCRQMVDAAHGAALEGFVDDFHRGLGLRLLELVRRQRDGCRLRLHRLTTGMQLPVHQSRAGLRFPRVADFREVRFDLRADADGDRGGMPRGTLVRCPRQHRSYSSVPTQHGERGLRERWAELYRHGQVGLLVLRAVLRCDQYSLHAGGVLPPTGPGLRVERRVLQRSHLPTRWRRNRRLAVSVTVSRRSRRIGTLGAA